jgi:hypothetical protein
MECGGSTPLFSAMLDSPAATARLRQAAALQMNEIITIERMSNRRFLESHALACRVGLVGGTTLIEKVIRRASEQQLIRRNGFSAEWTFWRWWNKLRHACAMAGVFPDGVVSGGG